MSESQDYTEDNSMAQGDFSNDSYGDNAKQNDAPSDSAAANGSAPETMDQDISDPPQTHEDHDSSSQHKDEDRKLFVGALSWSTTDKELREYFGKFGEIESVVVKIDPQTGRSRGFAFLVFKSADSLNQVLSAGEHMIGGKRVDPKRAKARTGKIFVGGLPQDCNEDTVRSFFSQFGAITEIEMPFDKVKNQKKNFCFVTFDNENVVFELLKTPKQVINGKEVDIKKAAPKQDAFGSPAGRGGRGAPGGSRGAPRGRGGWNSWGGQGSYGGGYSGAGYGGAGGYGSGYGGGYGYDYYGGYDSYGGYGGSSYSGYGGSAPGAYGGGGKQRGAGGRPTTRHQPY